MYLVSSQTKTPRVMFCNYLQCAAGLCSCCGGTTCENGACNPISKQNLLVPTYLRSKYCSVISKHSKLNQTMVLNAQLGMLVNSLHMETHSQLTLQKNNVEEAVTIKQTFDKLGLCLLVGHFMNFIQHSYFIYSTKYLHFCFHTIDNKSLKILKTFNTIFIL